jgi:DNA-binding PadR family transcriptional regulator
MRSQTIYELNQAFKQGISLFYSASYGSLQSTLKKLLEKDWVTMHQEQSQGRLKKVYTIHPDGRAAFLKWMNDEAEEGNKLEVTALSKLFFLGLIEDREQRAAIVADLTAKMEAMERQLTALEGQLEQLPISADGNPVLKFQMKTLKYGIDAHRFAKSWFQDLMDEL